MIHPVVYCTTTTLDPDTTALKASQGTDLGFPVKRITKKSLAEDIYCSH